MFKNEDFEAVRENPYRYTQEQRHTQNVRNHVPKTISFIISTLYNYIEMLGYTISLRLPIQPHHSSTSQRTSPHSNASQPTQKPPRVRSPTSFCRAFAATIRQPTTMGCNIAPHRRMLLAQQTMRTATSGHHLRRHDLANTAVGQRRHLPSGRSDALRRRRRRRKPQRRPRLHYRDETPSSEIRPCEL
jgi:hypothetical protein